jgi:flagellar hook assembly protein FlgD
VVNYPNPFMDKTSFTFMVGGALPPKSGEIAIFTVAGRRVKTIRLGAAQMNIGFNRVDWDGRDGDGDRLANGVYLYRVTVDNGEAKQEVVEKLVVMR